MMKQLFLFIMVMISTIQAIAQGSPEMADTMRSDGKIYVVVGVLVLIFAVLFTYLMYLGRRLKKLEESADS